MKLEGCVICGSTENINTEMTINVEGQKVRVVLCDEHAEDTTPKAAKQSYLDRTQEIQQVIEKARALGLTVNMPDDPSKLAIADSNESEKASPPPKSAKSQEQSEKTKVKPPENLDDGFVDTEVVDKMQSSIPRNIKSNVGGTNLGSHTPYSKDMISGEQLSEDVFKGKAKIEVVEGRRGSQVPIPGIRTDGTGTTRTRVVHRVTDADLQARFKRLAQDTIQTSSGHEVSKHGFAVDGYDVRDCGFCGGEGTVRAGKNRTVTCPKCKGSGLML